MSTVLNTAAKVKEIYGGTTWTQVSGRFLLAANSTYTVKATGGSANAIIPYHRHSVAKITNGAASKTLTGSFNSHQLGPSASELYYLLYNKTGIVNIAADSSSKVNSLNTSGAANVNSQKITITATHAHDVIAHNTDYVGTDRNTTGANMPPYYAVYIWERTA